MPKLTATQMPWLLLTDKEAAFVLRVSVKHFRNLVAGGQLPFPIRLGNSVRWKKSEIEQAIERQAAPAC